MTPTVALIVLHYAVVKALMNTTENIRWQHAVEKHVCFLFFFDELASSLLNNALEVVGVFLQLV